MKTACRYSVALLWGIIGGLLAPNAAAAWLQLGDSQLQDGVVYVPIVFDPGPDTVASLQFDVPYEARRFAFLHAEPGPAAISAGKDVLPGVRNGKVTVVVAGLNQSAIGAGILAGLYFELIPEGKGDARIALENHVLSDPRGNAVAHQRPRDESPSRSDRPNDATDAPTVTQRGSTAAENEQDGTPTSAPGADSPHTDDGASDPGAFGRFGPQALHNGEQPAETPDQNTATQPGSAPAESQAGVAGPRAADAPSTMVRTMPAHMPVVPARPATSPERSGPMRQWHDAPPSAHRDDPSAQRPAAKQEHPFGRVDAADADLPMSREQLAAIRAARASGAGGNTIASDSDTSGVIGSRPLPVGAMVFTGIAALALLLFALRRIGIPGMGRRSIRA